MIFGIGTDLCAADRMAAKLQKPAFVQRVFSPAEQALLNERGGTHRAETAAANFAANSSNSLRVTYSPANALTPHLSLTHENGLACAFVILEQNK